jgi:hypothetical protein
VNLLPIQSRPDSRRLQFVGVLFALLVLGAGPASRPAREISQWLAELGDKDQTIRTAARDKLMGLRRDELPQLLDAVKQARPLLPSQASGLREIVQQVYLSGEPYDKLQSGFLGVSLLDTIATVDGLPRQGVQILFRWPGCPGYRYLMDGDIIVGIDDVSPAGVDRGRFVDFIRKSDPGAKPMFRVFRQSRVIPVRVTLGARPVGEEANIENVMQDWLLKEAAYWQKNFAGLVDDTTAAGAG